MCQTEYMFYFSLLMYFKRVSIDNSTFERVEKFKQIKFLLRKKLRKIEVRKCLLSFGAEYFFFQVAIQKFKDQDI